ncbi:TPA: hypothetical protein ACITN2_004678 [Salmonella enterica subsp. enterica serovar Virchow]
MSALIFASIIAVGGLTVVVVKLSNRNAELYARVQELEQREAERQR